MRRALYILSALVLSGCVTVCVKCSVVSARDCGADGHGCDTPAQQEQAAGCIKQGIPLAYCGKA